MTKNVSVPEGYKKTELGAIPEEWEVIKIDHFCDVKTGGTPSTKNKDYWDGDILWMSSGEINKKFVYNTEKKITQKGLENSNARILPADSVMMALNGQGKTRGSVAVLKIPSTCNQSLACMIPNEKITHYLYLFYNLQSRYSEIRNYTGDTGREGLNLRIIKDMNVPLPPLPEQQKIASILSKVDEQIEQTEQIIEKTEILKKGLMQKLLIKGIGHTKFKKTELGEIPEEWKLMFLDKITDVIDPHPSHRAPKIVHEGYPFAGIGDILEDGTILTKKCRKVSEDAVIEQEKSFTIDNDIGFGRVGTVGKVVWLKKQTFRYSISPTLSIIKPKTVNRRYLFYAIKSEIVLQQINNFITGSTRESIGIMKLRKVKIPLPSQEEQQKIASILSKVDFQIQDNQSYLHKLQELKKGLMQDLLTGKVRVCV